MAFIYRYEFKQRTNRNSINLLNHKENLEKAISNQFMKNVESTKVCPNFFEFRLFKRASNHELRSLGKKIVAYDSKLNGVKKVNTKNTELFIRKPNKYYAYLDEFEVFKHDVYVKLDLIDKSDLDKILNTYQNMDNRTNNKVEILRNLKIFNLILDIKKDRFSKVFKQKLGQKSIGKWYILEGYNTKNKNNAQIFLDFKCFYHIEGFNLEMIDESEYEDSFKVNSKVIPVSSIDSEIDNRLRDLFSLKDIPFKVIYNEDIPEKSSNNKIIVYNVGQGLCSAICDNNLKPLIFYDFGGGERRDKVTYPKNVRFNFDNKPIIVLSHLHRDHWISVKYFKEALKCKWLIPNQVRKPETIKLCAELSKNGSLSVFTSNLSTPLVNIFKCFGDNSHYHNDGICLFVKLHNYINNKKEVKNFLFTGDNRYEYIPNRYKLNLHGLIASHHGGRYFRKKRNSYGQIVYSYGKHQKFHPHFNSHKHPSYVKDYRKAGWKEELHTPNGDCILY